MRGARIAFVYRGRYHVGDSVTLEYLSALALRCGAETSLVYDQDLFGVTDNVVSHPRFNGFFSHPLKTARRVADRAPALCVFLDGFHRREWNAAVARHLKTLRPAAVTLLVARAPLSAGTDDRWDYAAYGEPEAAFAAFLEGGGTALPRGAVVTAAGPADLDTLPLPDKKIFSRYIDFRGSYMIYASRGCPYACSFCEEAVYRKQLGEASCRLRAVETVIGELETARREFGIREVLFKDPVFTYDHARLARLLGEYRRRIGLPFKCFGKAGTVDDGTAALLKESGCYCIEFGAQTFNEEIKRGVLGRREEDVVRGALAACDRAGLRYDIDYMFGLPGERVEDHREAARIFRGLRLLNRVKCHTLVYYREADIYRHAPAGVRSASPEAADFFSPPVGTGGMTAADRAFSNLFKVLPLLPERALAFLLRGERWRLFGLIPSPLVVLCQALQALRTGDLRFRFYLGYYPRKVLSALREGFGGGEAR